MQAQPKPAPKRTPIRTFFKRLWHRTKIKTAAKLMGLPTNKVPVTPGLILAMDLEKRMPLMIGNYRGRVAGVQPAVKKSMELAYQQALIDVITYLIPETKPGLVARARALVTGAKA